jgi:IS5 family transposase
VHYPTDINLLLDAMRKIIIFVFRLCELTGLSGWRQHLHIFKKVKKLYRRAQGSTNSYRRSKKKKERKEKEMKEAHKKYVSECAKIIKKVKETIESTPVFEMKIIAIIYEIKRYIPHGERQIEQIIRRVLDGEKIPHEEKVFSIFEEHTEWISKGKAGVPQELGLNVCVIEDQYKFILYHEVMEKITDVEIAVPIAKKTLKMYPNLSVISYDRGFYSPQNKIDLHKILDEVILPKKGRLLKEEREYENSENFRELRRKHAAVESGINALENHGLDRCLDHGIIGFKRYVALAVLGRNLQNLGNIIQENKKKLKKHEEEKHKRVA